MLELRPLYLSDERSFLEVVDEFRREHPPWDFSLGYDDALGFREYLRRVECWSRGEELPAGFVRATFLVGVVGDRVVGRVSLRHRLNDYLRNTGGHIGYGVRPPDRGRGYATEMLRQTLPLCRALGITRALLTCDDDNTASARVIERCGGVLEAVVHDPVLELRRRRYWVEV